MSGYRTVALFGKQDSDAVTEALVELRGHLVQRGCTVLVDAAFRNVAGLVQDCADVGTIRRRADVAIVVGGDG
ncbi:MAG: hypothetical protein ACK4N6_02445, partial [Rhodocyclaceae bacterium]